MEALPDLVERPEWADENLMNATYALLYNTLEIEGRPFLRTQMAEDVWRAVYAPDFTRDRSLCWNDDNHRRLAYQPSRRLANRVVMPGPPRRRADALTGRSYEEQYSDGYLCGLHSLNNLANAVLLTPPDVLSAIEVRRNLDNPLAGLEDLILAALREGVFLLAVNMTSASDLTPLDSTETFPKNKCFLNMVERAGGLVIYQQYAQVSGEGHFVSLVDTGQGTPGVAPDNRWTVYSTRSIAARGATAAAAANRFIETSITGQYRASATTREARRRQIEEERERKFRADLERAIRAEKNPSRQESMRKREYSPNRFVGLLPISLRLMANDATGTLDVSTLTVSEYVELTMTRTIVRYVLSTLFEPVVNIPGNNALSEQVEVTSPGAVDELCRALTDSIEVDEDEESEGTEQSERMVRRVVFDGNDRTNVASFIFARHEVDLTLVRNADRLAGLLLAIRRPEPVNWESTITSILETLRRIRSIFRDERLGLGLLFNDNMDADDEMLGSKFTWLVSNRRWLRFVTLFLVATPVIDRLERYLSTAATDLVPVSELSPALQRLLALYCVIAYRKLHTYGIKLAATPHMGELFKTLNVLATRGQWLPLDSLPASIDPIVRTSPGGTQSLFTNQMLDPNYDWTIWLLNAARASELPGFGLPTIAPLLLPEDAPFDDMYNTFDQRFRFVALLRATLFRMPLAGQDSQQLERQFPEQSVSERTADAIRRHFAKCGEEFVERAFAGNFVSSEADALRWIETFAFDRRYASGNPVEAANDLTTHNLINDLSRPRFVELAGQFGFYRIQRRVFGKYSVAANDLRAPITTNVNRVPLPNPAGQWRATRPPVRANARLCTVSMPSLPLLSVVGRTLQRKRPNEEAKPANAAPAADDTNNKLIDDLRRQVREYAKALAQLDDQLFTFRDTDQLNRMQTDLLARIDATNARIERLTAEQTAKRSRMKTTSVAALKRLLPDD